MTDAPNPFDLIDAAARRAALSARNHAAYELYLRSDAWREQRAATIRAAGGACEDCGRSFLTTLEAHHLTYKHLGDEHPDDLMALCRPCHEARHEALL